jgi:hypothetical protein
MLNGLVNLTEADPQVRREGGKLVVTTEEAEGHNEVEWIEAAGHLFSIF